MSLPHVLDAASRARNPAVQQCETALLRFRYIHPVALDGAGLPMIEVKNQFIRNNDTVGK